EDLCETTAQRRSRGHARAYGTCRRCEQWRSRGHGGSCVGALWHLQALRAVELARPRRFLRRRFGPWHLASLSDRRCHDEAVVRNEDGGLRAPPAIAYS